MKRDKVLSMLSLAMKAGKVVSGEFSVEKAVKTGKACVVLVAGDASPNTKKAFSDSCDYYQIPCYVYGDKDTLGTTIGKQMRASLAVIDAGFAGRIEELIEEQNETEE